MIKNNKFSIFIKVNSRFIEEQVNNNLDKHFIFSYTVKITNKGTEYIQILNRHWIITDADGKTEEVKGVGVIGQQPVISPNNNFEYTSGVVLRTPVGSMQGSYIVCNNQGKRLKVHIQAFSLAIPELIH